MIVDASAQSDHHPYLSLFVKTRLFAYAKTKPQISCAVTISPLFSIVGASAQSDHHHYLSLVVKNLLFAYAKTKPQISCAVIAQLISAFVFATRIVQSLFFLNLKLQASTVQSGFCRTWSETPKTGILTTRLIYLLIQYRKLQELRGCQLSKTRKTSFCSDAAYL